MCNFSLLQPHGHFSGSTESLHLVSFSAPSHSLQSHIFRRSVPPLFGASRWPLVVKAVLVCLCMSLIFVLFCNLFNAFTSFIVSACGPPPPRCVPVVLFVSADRRVRINPRASLSLCVGTEGCVVVFFWLRRNDVSLCPRFHVFACRHVGFVLSERFASQWFSFNRLYVYLRPTACVSGWCFSATESSRQTLLNRFYDKLCRVWVKARD